MKKQLLTTLALLISLFSGSLLATEQNPENAYQVIDLQSSRHVEGHVEVAFYYAYGDPTSFELNKKLENWLQTIPETAYFIRRPSINSEKDWALALSYTRAEMLGKGDQVHAALFKALHQTPPTLNSMEDLVKFNADQGVNGNLPTHILQANFKRLSGEWMGNTFLKTPSVVVAQKYLLTKEMAGSNDELIKLISQLIEKESK